jgi:hypothetical protein
MSYAIYGHCASGFTELWDVKTTLPAAKKLGVKVLKDNPVTECGTGGVTWVEIIGTDVPQPETAGLPSYDQDPDAWKPYFDWEKTNVQLGLSREDNGNWGSA